MNSPDTGYTESKLDNSCNCNLNMIDHKQFLKYSLHQCNTENINILNMLLILSYLKTYCRACALANLVRAC